MGWSSISIHMYEDFQNSKFEFNRKKFLDHEYNSTYKNRKWEVVKSAMVGSTYYGAIRVTNLDTQESHVYGEVVITSIEKGEFFYKEMEECVGPYQYDCPIDILDLLSPTDNEYANKWRERCRERAKETAFRKRFWRLAQDKDKVDCIKYICEYDSSAGYTIGEVIYLRYTTAMVRGKLTKCWNNGLHRFRKKDINPEVCTLIMKDGSEFKMVI